MNPSLALIDDAWPQTVIQETEKRSLTGRSPVTTLIRTPRRCSTGGGPTLSDLARVRRPQSAKDTPGFLMTREIQNQKSLESALHSIQPSVPHGKSPGILEFTNDYYNISDADDAPRLLEGRAWPGVGRDAGTAVDGCEGPASVQVSGRHHGVDCDGIENRFDDRATHS